MGNTLARIEDAIGVGSKKRRSEPITFWTYLVTKTGPATSSFCRNHRQFEDPNCGNGAKAALLFLLPVVAAIRSKSHCHYAQLVDPLIAGQARASSGRGEVAA
jgi:hypothetical protein